ncbi:guanine nucleotide exchange factor [Capsaspora owczarzaki ATCC 30864]|nr:guanine nucleotide exchange factor [Capsaspora owczarzaki ATCC 30864]|eukprot:XP_004349414.2 guanine nucleotide exchange factor [Capsaspora owczarzaki ATCC 30864]
MLAVETKYMRDVDMVVKIFLELFESAKDSDPSLFTERNIVYIFCNIREIHDFEREFVYALEEAREFNPKKPLVGAIFEDMALEEKFEVYSEYAANFENSRRELEAILRDPRVIAFLEARKMKEAVMYVLPKLLFEPLYQVFHYFDLLKILLKCTETSDPDHNSIRQAQISLMNLEDELKRTCKDFLVKRNNTYLKHGKNSAVSEGIFKDIQMKIENWEGSDLAIQCSDLYKEGLVQSKDAAGSKMLTTSKERYLIVFDNLILLCKPRGQPSANCDFHVKERIKTSSLTVREIQDTDDMKFAIEITTSDGKRYPFGCKSPIEKAEWLEALHTLAVRPTLEKTLDKKIAEAEASDGPLLELLNPGQYVFAQQDSVSNILHETEEGQTNGPPVIKGGSIYKLVERLTYPSYADPNYLTQFLITYRSFCTPTDLLNLLIERYNVPEPVNVPQEQLLRFRKNYITPVRLRVFNVFRQWVDKHYYDFENNTDLLKRFLEFIKDSMSGDKKMDKAVKSLTRAVRQRRETIENAKTIIFSDPPPPTEKGSAALDKIEDFDVLSLSPIEIARQLTLIESDIYRTIKPSELVGQPWVKSDKEERSPNVLKMIHRFNAVSRWVATCVVDTESLKERVDVIINFLEVLAECERLNNFNGMMEILSGLQATSVYRLKFTWAEVPAKKRAILDDAASLLSRDGNFKKLRERLHTVNPPCIPFFGMYLTDLTFIEDGTTDYLPTANDAIKLINFTKRRRVASVIAEIALHQNLPYNLAVVQLLQDFCYHAVFIEEEEGFAKSLEIEPRNAEKAPDAPSGKPTRLRRSASTASMAKDGRMQRASSQQDLNGFDSKRLSQTGGTIGKRTGRANSGQTVLEDEEEAPAPAPALPPKSRPVSVMSVSPDSPGGDSGAAPPIPARNRRQSEVGGSSPPVFGHGTPPSLPPKVGMPLTIGSPSLSHGFGAGPNSPGPNSPGGGFNSNSLKNKAPPPLPPKAGVPGLSTSPSNSSPGVPPIKSRPLPTPPS